MVANLGTVTCLATRGPTRLGLGLAAAALLGACQSPLPPLPSTLLVVDTDVDLPRTVSRLRIDVYDDAGTWLHSRDVARIRSEDWPASFGIASSDDGRAHDVFVRLRAYPEGATRQYRGGAFEEKPTYVAPSTSSSLASLCASLEPLPPLTERTLRRGAARLTVDGCYAFDHPGDDWIWNGSVGVGITIVHQGKYRFEVIRSNPAGSVDTTLSLRTDCGDPQSEISCDDNISATNFLSRLELDLPPGKYALLTGGVGGQTADLTLRWALATQWGPDPALPDPPPVPARSALETAGIPRLVTAGVDETPDEEPSPFATIDRVVRVTLSPDRATRTRVTLHGACAGSPAALPPVDSTHVAIDQLRSCDDDPATFAAPAALAASDAAASSPSLQGTMIAEPCLPGDSDDEVVCVPGGTFQLGGRDLAGFDSLGLETALPVRFVGLRRFWIDRREVTVGRYRQAVAAGFVDGSSRPPVAWDGGASSAQNQDTATFTSARGANEELPLNMVTWARARAFCIHSGGDLPSEAQWEYAAGVAGRDSKATFPWGEADPSCGQAVVQRTTGFVARCAGAMMPASVRSAAALSDVTPLGIEGMGGNVSEWVLDSPAHFDDPCWQVAGAVGPTCGDPGAPSRILRGGSWKKPAFYARTVLRNIANSGSVPIDAGMRCVYPSSPARRWTAP